MIMKIAKWILLLAVFQLVSCEIAQKMMATPIAEIVENPENYDGKNVTIYGEVIEHINVPLVIQAYKVKDDSGKEIYVIADKNRQSLPEKNSSLQVSGTVDQAVKIMKLKVVCINEKMK